MNNHIQIKHQFQADKSQTNTPITDRRGSYTNELEFTKNSRQTHANHMHQRRSEGVFESMNWSQQRFKQMQAKYMYQTWSERFLSKWKIKHQIKINPSQIYAPNTATGVFVQTNLCWPPIQGRPKPNSWTKHCQRHFLSMLVQVKHQF